MIFGDDLTAFFKTNEFAEAATITPTTGSPIALTVQFHRSDLSGNQYTGDVEEEDSFAVCITTDIASLPASQRVGTATVTVGGKTYKLTATTPTGTGTTRLSLYDPDSTT